MRNKKIITLLLAATVAITSVAPSIQVKAEETEVATTNVASGSAVTVEQTAAPVETATPNRTGKIWYKYNNVKYCYDKELEKFVLECEKCGKTITAYSACRYKIQQHIKNCKGKKTTTTTTTTIDKKTVMENILAGYGEDVIGHSDYPETVPSFKKWSDFKGSKLMITDDYCGLVNLPKSVKTGTKVTFQLKGQKKYVTKLKCDKKNKVKYAHFDYKKSNAGVSLYNPYFGKKYKGKHNWHKKTFKFKTYKKYHKVAKKYDLQCGEGTFMGKEELTITIKGYGTYVLNVSEYCGPLAKGLYLKWK